MKIPDIKKLKGSRLSNPCPVEKQIFLCGICLEHKYMPEKVHVGNICRSCFDELKADQASEKTSERAVETERHSSEVLATDVQETGGDSADAITARDLETGGENQAGSRIDDGG